MRIDLESLDPATAWAEFKPTKGQWNHRAVAHFHRRAGFGATQAEIVAGLKATPAELAKAAVSAAASEAEETTFETLGQSAVTTNNADQLAAAWLYRMLHTSRPLVEKISLLWHGHFATSNEKVQDVELMRNQNTLLRQHALGDFKELVHGIAKDPAMLIYLDSESNRKAHPNENFARELMELFVLGEGNYSEDDVRELSRCFTGWELRRKRYRFNRYQHDRKEKSFLGASGNFGGEDGVDIVLKHRAGPRFIARKLVRFFVCEEPDLPQKFIDPIARQLRDDGLQIGPAVQRIISSNIFYASAGHRVRSPVEMGAGLLRSLQGSANVTELAVKLRRLGHGLFHPPNVKGWDGGRTWINSSTLLSRANLVRSILKDENTRFDEGGLDTMFDKLDLDEKTAVAWLDEMLFAIPISDAARTEVGKLIGSSDGSRDQRFRKAIHALSVQPEFQLC